jgi:hypothetical protein
VEINNIEEDNSNKTQGNVSGYFNAVYLKYYYISLAVFVAGIIINYFSDKADKPEIGFWAGVAMLVFVPPFTAVGAFIGRKFRDYTKPDFIMTSGAAETFKTKLFWQFGPQIIGWFISLMIVSNIVG